jgi:hypothetical protein
MTIKKSFLSLIFIILAGFIYGRNLPSQLQPPDQEQTQSAGISPGAFENHIHSGFYLKLGGSFPMGEFPNSHNYPYKYNGSVDTIRFNGAKFGGVFEAGYLIYLGPSFANHHLRAGIDATFFAVSFNPTDQKLPANSSTSKKFEYWYYLGGQKFGPLFTINPVDYLMIDLSYKLNASAAWYHSMWGMNLALNEVSLGIRYRLIMFAFQYNWGKIKFTYNHDDNPQYQVDVTTFRVLIGIKF